jgi:ABC-type sugar transport system ATPase subunit
MAGISKAFFGVPALIDVAFASSGGEVHAIVGENGAGKSTLIKILAGAVRADAGEIRINGAEVQIDSASDARASGISVAYQEFNLFPEFTVAQNIWLGREPRKMGIVDRKRMSAQTRDLLDGLGIGLAPDAPVAALGVAERQLLELVRALSYEPSILVLDEPTAALNQREQEHLLVIIDGLRERGVCVVYISHRLEEIGRIADRVTVLKDGRKVATRAAATLAHDELVRLMVGREVESNLFPPRAVSAGEVVLRVESVDEPGLLNDVSLDVRAGEIVGIAGLVGAGRSSLARAIYGAMRPSGGRVLIGDRTVPLGSPTAAVAAGVAYLSEDRKRDGLALQLTTTRNLTSVTEPDRYGLVSRAEERRLARRLADSVRVSATALVRKVRHLSGGNQQKVVLGKWLGGRPRVFIVDEPTLGIDVGAKAEIYRLLRGLAEGGSAVLVMSSDLLEVLNLSDRVLVMRAGSLVAEFPAAEATEERVMAAAVGVAA